ncbi:DNA polymerase III subunit delta' [Flavimobilis sp. GY10621]|uniref:DNA polymerase III subunit delta n=1 Tax=Flavimobilis rhizosphaerae TaxID=2775421 RepID=A0ABR9DLN8_9MICO|nr:DNA polymerase III subunit delta' [Flavimobilis rhizosphaerae]MBD9698055.1 DNA polymerase III subunit delta' [Flavimobilis rhizosphaerae]
MTDVWEDVVGQEDAVARLRAAATDDAAMTHAWLVTGPPGSGRSVAAKAFAAALQCSGDPVADEVAVAEVRAGTHPDVTVVTTDKVTISIDEVRGLIGLAQRAPARGRWRVIVVEDADRMLERTSNVLLKAIEEPPPRTVWVLCAPSPQDVVVTIRSRCRQVGLRVPSVEAVAELLVRRDGLEPGLALESARAAQSHVGMARRLARDPEARARRRRILESAARIRGVGDAVLAADDLVETAKAEAAARSEERDAREKAELLRALGVEAGATVPPALRAQVKQLEEDQKRRATRQQRDSLDTAMLDLLSLYRDVLVVQLGASGDVALVNEGAEELVRSLAESSTPEQSLHRMDAIGEVRQRLAGNVAPLLALEAMMVALRPQV